MNRTLVFYLFFISASMIAAEASDPTAAVREIRVTADGDNVLVEVDLTDSVTPTVTFARNPDRLIADSIQALCAVALSPEELQFIKTSILLSGLTGMSSDHYWTNAWNACQSNPDDKANRNLVTNKLKNLYRHLMDLPEYQLL